MFSRAYEARPSTISGSSRDCKKSPYEDALIGLVSLFESRDV